MEKNKVIDVINSELNYIEQKEKDNSGHVVEDFPLSSAMEAIRYNLDKANNEWYLETAPYENSMHYFRKIAAICIKMGIKYGMPNRKYTEEEKIDIFKEFLDLSKPLIPIYRGCPNTQCFCTGACKEIVGYE